MDDYARQLCIDLASQSKDVAALLAEHLAENDEVLPHVFLASVTRYILSNPPQRTALVNYIEEKFANSPRDVQDLIAVAFVENLVTKEDLDLALSGTDSPALRREWYLQNEA